MRALLPLLAAANLNDPIVYNGRDRYNESVREYNAAIGGRGLSSLVALVGSFPPLRPLDLESAGS